MKALKIGVFSGHQPAVNAVDPKSVAKYEGTAYNYQCDIVIFREGFPGGLKENGNSINNVFANKDTVVVCYKKTQKGELFASGCWYFEKGQKTTEYKFDYGKNTFIGSDEVFYTPDK